MARRCGLVMRPSGAHALVPAVRAGRRREAGRRAGGGDGQPWNSPHPDPIRRPPVLWLGAARRRAGSSRTPKRVTLGPCTPAAGVAGGDGNGTRPAQASAKQKSAHGGGAPWSPPCRRGEGAGGASPSLQTRSRAAGLRMPGRQPARPGARPWRPPLAAASVAAAQRGAPAPKIARRRRAARAPAPPRRAPRHRPREGDGGERGGGRARRKARWPFSGSRTSEAARAPLERSLAHLDAGAAAEASRPLMPADL